MDAAGLPSPLTGGLGSGWRRGWAPGWRSAGAARSRSGASGRRNDFAAILQLVLAIDNHDIARIQPIGQANAVACGQRDSDGMNFHLVVVADRIDVRSLWAALNSWCRNDGQIVPGVHEKVHIHELIGEERVVHIGKNGFQLVRAGGEINLSVGGDKFSRSDLHLVFTIVGFDRELYARAQLGVHRRQLILRQTENYRDRLELGDDEKTIRIRGVHDVAGIDEPETDAPADGSSNAGIR